MHVRNHQIGLTIAAMVTALQATQVQWTSSC
jgi:hypothetical protein